MPIVDMTRVTVRVGIRCESSHGVPQLPMVREAFRSLRFRDKLRG